ncbi:hypothetical protein BsWGS_14191 [Bradybaena similaris]
MKLKDFVFNSLRVKRKKKKASSSADAAVGDLSTGCFGLDKNRNWFPSSQSRSRSQGSNFEDDSLIDANWQGNALYKGMVFREEIKENCSLVALDYSSCNPGSISQSNLGTSSSFTDFDRALDNISSQDTVSENLDSYSSMSPLSEADAESSPSHPQFYSYHFHHGRHNIHTGHEFHSKKVTTLLQHHNQSINNVQNLGFKYSQALQKPEIGFFRKSLASLKNIRKDSSKTKPAWPKQAKDVQMDCKMSFLPEETPSVNKMDVYKMPAKIKKRGSKLFAKLKENRDVQFSSDNFENQWTLESRNENDVKSVKVKMDPFISNCMLYDRPYVRESSVESCPPRHYGFQEELSMRDLELTGFESASCTGYESDISRSRGRKARSRIKTNPWLPSPQLTHSVARRWTECSIREPSDNFPLLEERYGFPPPDLLEYHESGLHTFQAYPKTNSRRYHRKHSTRKSPNGIRMAVNLNASSPYSFTKRTLDQQYNSFASCRLTSSRASSLNDLSNNTPTARDASVFSPNTEFSMLAENLEQLAANISFEYDDTFDTTMESVSAGKESCSPFFRELCTNDENSQNPQPRASQESRIHMTHSPDSGVGGLGYSDGDNNLTPPSHREANGKSMEYLFSILPDTSCKALKEVAEDNCISRRRKESRTNSSRDALKPYYCGALTTHISTLPSPHRSSPQITIPARKGKHEGNCVEERCSSAMTDCLSCNKACHRDTQMATTTGACDGPAMCKASHAENTKLSEDECPTTEISTLNDKLFRPTGRVGTDGWAPREMIEVEGLDKQSSECVPVVDETTVVKTSRPSALNTDSQLALNNMEKASGSKKQQLSWMDEFDFPRNITTSESLESPTENWQWDYQFAMYHSLDAGSPGQQLYRVVFDDGLGVSADMLDNGRQSTEVEELVVKLEDTDSKVSLQGEISESAGAKDRVVNGFSQKIENGTLGDDNFEMNDACVQTDFDDDFDNLEEMSNIDDMEEALYDVSEGTHLWLPTRNVGDSWTQDKNHAKDSEIIHSESVVFGSEDRKKCGTAEDMGSEKCQQNKLAHLRVESKTCVYSDTYSHAAVSADSQAKSHDLPLTKLEPRLSEEIMKQLFSDLRLLTVEKQPDLLSTLKPTIHSSRTTPETTVHIPFSDNETQFKKIFNQNFDETQINSERPQVSIHSPETIVELSGFNCSPPEVVQREDLVYQRNQRSEANPERTLLITTNNAQYSDDTSVCIPPAKTLVNYKTSNRPILKLEKVAELSHVDNNGNFLYNPSRLKRSSESFQRSHNSKRDNFDDFVISPLNANKAAYLTFESDSPVCRSLVERPLCLVPGANPFSRLRLEPIKSISLNSACDNEDLASWVSSTSAPFYATSLVTNCKYIHESKNNNQSLLQANENVTHLFAQGQSRSHASEAHYSLQILTDQVDNFALSSPVNENSNEKSEMVSNSVYSFAKSPNYLKCEDFTHTSLLKTVSYSAAAGAKEKAGKCRVSSMSPGAQQTSDSTRKCLAGRVLSLCQEKDLIFQKIYEAKQEEMYRKEHRLQIQRKMQAQTREALLQPLIELKHKLEEQSKRLSDRCNVSGNSKSPFRFL